MAQTKKFAPSVNTRSMSHEYDVDFPNGTSKDRPFWIRHTLDRAQWTGVSCERIRILREVGNSYKACPNHSGCKCRIGNGRFKHSKSINRRILKEHLDAC